MPLAHAADGMGKGRVKIIFTKNFFKSIEKA